MPLAAKRSETLSIKSRRDLLRFLQIIIQMQLRPIEFLRSYTPYFSAWFPASTRPRSFEGTRRQGSDLLMPGQKPAKLFKLLNHYLENRLSVACVQSFFRVN